MTTSEKNQIQEKIFDLRNAQCNCTPAERAQIQKQIEALYKVMDAG